VKPRVRLLGRPYIEGEGQPYRQPRGFKSWSLLARVALADRPSSRRELATELFESADDPLGALRWSLADLRRSLELPDALRGSRIQLTPNEVWLDVWALEDGSLPTTDIGGMLLDGVELRHCPSFDTWLLLARAHVAARSSEELRNRALKALAIGDAEAAVAVSGRAARLSPLDDAAQELFLRALVAAGHEGQASVHLAQCIATFAREGLEPSPALRAAARGRGPRPRTGLRASVVARSLFRAGEAALSAGAADAGVETLRRAAEEAERARNPALEAEVLSALGGALVHAVRGFDGEGAVVLHRALVLARTAQRPDIAAESLRELAFVDVLAGRHASAERALCEASEQAGTVADDALKARILATQGMNAADRGRHIAAAALLSESADTAGRVGHRRQQIWSRGLLARSLLFSGNVEQARTAAQASIDQARHERWMAFLPWPQAVLAHVLVEEHDLDAARENAEEAFALACELADPCWEGMAARAIGVIETHAGNYAVARRWLTDARRRNDRVSDHYAWVSGYIGLADLELAVRDGSEGAGSAAARLRDDALHADLPEFLAWALVHEAEAGVASSVQLAAAAAEGLADPALHRRLRALTT
jgi:DNA-binding SARP family transcriptional activator